MSIFTTTRTVKLEGVHSTTFFNATQDSSILQKQAARLAEDVAFKLRRIQKLTHNLQLRAWNAAGVDTTYNVDIQVGVNDSVLLLQYVQEMITLLAQNPITCNGLSITASALEEEKVQIQGDVLRQLSGEMDTLKHRYGRNLVRFAACL